MILRGEDDGGNAVIKVELTNRPGAFVTLDEDDYSHLLEAGVEPRWFLNEAAGGLHYVRCYLREAPGRPALVARKVVKARPGQCVTYRNGDRLDLRRRNLVVNDRRPAPRRTKPDYVILGAAAGQDMSPSGTMGVPEATSGYTYASA